MLFDIEKINVMVIEFVENIGLVFLDEIDKVVVSEGKSVDVFW